MGFVGFHLADPRGFSGPGDRRKRTEGDGHGRTVRTPAAALVPGHVRIAVVERRIDQRGPAVPPAGPTAGALPRSSRRGHTLGLPALRRLSGRAQLPVSGQGPLDTEAVPAHPDHVRRPPQSGKPTRPQHLGVVERIQVDHVIAVTVGVVDPPYVSPGPGSPPRPDRAPVPPDRRWSECATRLPHQRQEFVLAEPHDFPCRTGIQNRGSAVLGGPTVQAVHMRAAARDSEGHRRPRDHHEPCQDLHWRETALCEQTVDG